MLDLLWLLLPVAAASGWWAARRGQRRHRVPLPCQEINTEYFRGLNFLLNEQPDKAIEVLKEDVDKWKKRPQPKLRKASERPGR